MHGGEKKKKKRGGVGGRSEHRVPGRASDAQKTERGARAPTRYLRGPRVCRTQGGAPGAPASLTEDRGSSATEPFQTPPNAAAAATPPRSCGPSPPRAGPRNRLRVTSPPPSPSAAAPARPLAAARPEPNAPHCRLLCLGPGLTARGAPPAVAGGATLPQSTQTSSARDRQLRAGCTSRPSHGASGDALAPPPPSVTPLGPRRGGPKE